LFFAHLPMPRMCSLDLLLNIRAMRPHVAVIIITAFGKWGK